MLWTKGFFKVPSEHQNNKDQIYFFKLFDCFLVCLMCLFKKSHVSIFVCVYHYTGHMDETRPVNNAPSSQSSLRAQQETRTGAGSYKMCVHDTEGNSWKEEKPSTLDTCCLPSEPLISTSLHTFVFFLSFSTPSPFVISSSTKF